MQPEDKRELTREVVSAFTVGVVACYFDSVFLQLYVSRRFVTACKVELYISLYVI